MIEHKIPCGDIFDIFNISEDKYNELNNKIKDSVQMCMVTLQDKNSLQINLNIEPLIKKFVNDKTDKERTDILIGYLIAKRYKNFGDFISVQSEIFDKIQNKLNGMGIDEITNLISNPDNMKNFIKKYRENYDNK